MATRSAATVPTSLFVTLFARAAPIRERRGSSCLLRKLRSPMARRHLTKGRQDARYTRPSSRARTIASVLLRTCNLPKMLFKCHRIVPTPISSSLAISWLVKPRFSRPSTRSCALLRGSCTVREPRAPFLPSAAFGGRRVADPETSPPIDGGWASYRALVQGRSLLVNQHDNREMPAIPSWHAPCPASVCSWR